MEHIKKNINILVDGGKQFQEIDGFGVNINSKYWDNGNLVPVMDLLVKDLGATIYRLDAYGKSNWVDPEDRFDAGILNQETYARVYSGIDFKNAQAMSQYLNDHGIEPYITISGVVPKWMCDGDGKTLKEYGQFAEMVASYIHWAKKEAGIRFTLFGPINETDLGPPEGPLVSPEEYVKVVEVLSDTFDRWGLSDIRFVVAEQGIYNLEFARHLVASQKLKGKLAVFGIHAYSDYHCDDLVELVHKSEYKDSSIWMTEYGDLDQTGEKEWYVAWVSFQRLMRLLKDGLNGALNWDAYDNYHDHDEAWTIYGIIRSARKIYTPKKRYYSSKQVYRFVRPGFVRIEAVSGSESIPVLAFRSKDGKDVTVLGMNESQEDVFLNIAVEGLDLDPQETKVDIYRTTVEENCAKVATVDVTSKNFPYTGIQVVAPAGSIFTATTVKV